MEINGDINTQSSNAKGGFLSSLLILGTSLGTGIASGAWYCNLIVFLINEFNVKSIQAAQINNIFSGCMSFFPFIAAVAVDSTFSSFSIVLISSLVSLAGVILLTFIVAVKSLRPPPCSGPNSNICVAPSTLQYWILYIALGLASFGLGGSRFILGTMGANQFNNPKHQARFFNWFAFILYVGFIVGYTILIYLEDSVSWVLAYTIALIANVIAIIVFLAGSRLYRIIPPQGSPFTSLARVFVAAIKKRNMKAPAVDREQECYHYQKTPDSKLSYQIPSKSMRFLNKAAMIDGSNPQQETKSWSLCTVEEVEDLKNLIKIMPLWSTSILVSTPVGVAVSLTVLMALVMDRSIGSHFKIPAGTFVVISFIFTAVTTSPLDHFIYPAYKKLTGRNLTYLQGLGIGHVSNILAMIGFALIEHKRLKLVEALNLTSQPNSVAPMSALWLVIPLAILGIGEGFYFPAEVGLFYQEFPRKLKNTSTAMLSLHIAVGFYLSSAFINLVGRLSSWLPNDINFGRVDNVWLVLLIMVGLNFAYFFLCSMLYKYNNQVQELDGQTVVVPS